MGVLERLAVYNCRKTCFYALAMGVSVVEACVFWSKEKLLPCKCLLFAAKGVAGPVLDAQHVSIAQSNSVSLIQVLALASKTETALHGVLSHVAHAANTKQVSEHCQHKTCE